MAMRKHMEENMSKFMVLVAMVLMVVCAYVPAYADCGVCEADVAAEGEHSQKTEDGNIVDPSYAIIKNNVETPQAVLEKLARGENVPKETIERAKNNLNEVVNLLNAIIPGE
jgi:hypothetical protein